MRLRSDLWSRTFPPKENLVLFLQSWNRALTCLATTTAAAFTVATATVAGATLQVGCAQVDITPELNGDRPVWMAGYGHNRRAVRVHDPLYTTALVLSDGASRFALVSVDLVGLQRPDVLRIRSQLADFEYVMVASTHNHEGPDVIGIWGPTPLESGVDPQYVNSVVAKTVQCVNSAAADLKPTQAAYGTAEVAVDLLRDARTPLVRDRVIRVLMFRDAETQTKPLALLVQYSCHPESLGSRNTALTADFPFATIAALKDRYACPIAYFTGAVGGLMTHPKVFVDDVGQSYTDGNFEFADAYGRAIAATSIEAVEVAQPVVLTPLRFAAVEVAAPLSNPLYRTARAIGVLQRQGLEYRGDWRDVSRAATPSTLAERLGIKTEVACLALGEVTVAAIPGEIYPELVYGQYQEPVEPNADFPEAPLEPSLMDSLKNDRVLFFGLANDEIGYVIPRRQWDQASPFAYGRDSSQYGEVNSCGPETAPILMEAFQETALKLRETR